MSKQKKSYKIKSPFWQPEFSDFIKVLEFGEKKHPRKDNSVIPNWLESDGNKSSFKEMHDSMFHHLAESFSKNRRDEESNIDPLLHLACRALMMYTRLQRGIKHKTDFGMIVMKSIETCIPLNLRTISQPNKVTKNKKNIIKLKPKKGEGIFKGDLGYNNSMIFEPINNAGSYLKSIFTGLFKGL